MLSRLILIRLKGLFLRQTTSSKNKKSSIGKMILFGFLFAYVGVVCFIMFGALFNSLVEPLHLMNLDWLYFALMSLLVIILCFVGSVFIVEHEIYEAKDNELLLSMPIKNSDILLSRVFMILILNYIYELVVAGPAFFIYVMKMGMTVAQMLIFLIIYLTLPLFIMAITCFVAWIVAHIMKRVQHKNIIALVVWIAFFALYFYAIQYIEEYIALLIINGKNIADAIQQAAFPIYHLAIAIQESSFISLLYYLVCVLVPFGLVMYILSHNFIKMATTQPKVKRIEYVEKPMKQKSILMALLQREFQHFTSNVMIMMNGAIGVILQIIATVALFFYISQIKDILLQLPMLNEYVTPIICMVGIGMASMNMITASSISLEGDRLWIIKALPISNIDILHAKLLLHLLLCIPTEIVFCIIAGILMEVPRFDYIIIVGLPVGFIVCIALLGLLMNLWKPKFDWINETVCVKQSMSVVITMFVSMGFVFVATFLYVLLMDMVTIQLFIYSLFIFIVVLDILGYYLLKTWGVQRFNSL